MAQGPRREDDGLSGEPPAFSDEGMRRIIYGQDRGQDRGPAGDQRDSRSAAFADDTAELEADLRGRRGLVPVVTALAALFCFGAIVWYAYTWGTGRMTSEELPLVRAEPMPERVRPDQPGGLDVPYQDKLVLNDGTAGEAAPRVERLLPPPETPTPPQPLAKPLAARDAAQIPDDLTGTPAPEAPLIAEAPAAPEATSPAQAPAQAPAAAAEAGTAVPLPPVALAEAEIVKPLPKPTGEAAGAKDQIAALLDQEPMETAGSPSGQLAALAPGDLVVQLSSVKSEATARSEWGRLQKAHPTLLGPLALAVEIAEVKGSTYYRVQTGPFADRGAAAALCAELKARNQDCLVKER